MKRLLLVALGAVLGLAVGVALGATVVAGDSGPSAADFIDNEKVERSIESDVRKQRNRVSFVTCPALQKIAKGEEFVCVATTLNNRRTRFLVTQTDEKGNVRYRALP